MKKIILSTGSTYHLGLERTCKVASFAGFKFIELIARSLEEPEAEKSWNIDYLKKLEKNYGFKIISIHPPMDFEFMAEKYYENLIKLASGLDAKLIIHLPRYKEKYLQYQKWFTNNISKIRENRILFIENMPTSEYELDFLNSFNSFCLDTTHAQKAGLEPAKMIKSLNNLKEIHLSYFNGVKDHLSPLANKKFLDAILKNNNDANIRIELKPHSFSDSEDENVIIRELNDIRSYIEKHN